MVKNDSGQGNQNLRFVKCFIELRWTFGGLFFLCLRNAYKGGGGGGAYTAYVPSPRLPNPVLVLTDKLYDESCAAACMT